MRPTRFLSVCLGLLALVAGSTPVLADHGAIPWGSSDAEPYGRARSDLVECFPATTFSQAQIAIPLPWTVSTSKATAENEAQLVLWTPRVWWRTQDNPPMLDHTHVELWSSTYDWHYAWVRAGDYKDAWMVPYRNEMFTGGSAYPAWTNQRTKVTDPANFRVTGSLNLDVSRIFIVEEIIYWGGTSLDDGDEWQSRLRPVSGSFYQELGACTF